MQDKTILVSGFKPFAGRKFNSSWEAISWMTPIGGILEELPVVWGEPTQRLLELAEKFRPHTILAFGEGREGWFDLEMRALNQRDEREDERGLLPEVKFNWIGGPDEHVLATGVGPLHEFLLEKSYPVRKSQDAGQYLCEETIYALERLRQQYEEVERVMFCHLPPYQTKLILDGKSIVVDARLLKTFVMHVLSFLKVDWEESDTSKD